MFNSKKLLFSFSIIITLGAFLFMLTSASTVKKSNEEGIHELHEDLAKLQDRVDFLKSAENPNWEDPTMGQVAIFAGNFAPRGWAFCDGQVLPIAQNTALFSLLGTTYGGDGRTTFNLPDLDGRVPLHVGSHHRYTLGQKGQVIGVKNAEDAKSLRYLGLNYIIALQGTYPSRS